MARNIYKQFMHPSQLDVTDLDIEEDRFDLTTEISIARQHLARLLKVQNELTVKHPGKEELLIAVSQQQMEAVQSIAKVVKTARDVENAGQVFTNEKVASLVDKIAALVMYRVSACEERAVLLEDMGELTSSFRQASVRGTLVTPDQDAAVMDSTIPKLCFENTNDDAVTIDFAASRS